MAKFLDALLGRSPTTTANDAFAGRDMFSGASVATEGQPVPVAMVTQPPSDLTTSLDNKAAVGAWPPLIESGKLNTGGGWVRSWRIAPFVQVHRGNYGGADSDPNWQFVGRAFGSPGGYGNYPWEGVPSPYLKEYNELTPIHWQDRVDNENIAEGLGDSYGDQTGNRTVNKTSTFIPTATASLKGHGETLL